MTTTLAPPRAAGGDQGIARDADVARAAALFADPSRAAILKALADGRPASAAALAAEAGTGASTASAHLAKLVDAGLIVVERRGRNRYFRLAGIEVSTALEALAVLAPPLPVASLRDSTRANALRRARTCYDHLAGRLGVAVMRALLDRGLLVGADGLHHPETAVFDHYAAYGRDLDYRLTDAGRSALTDLGVDFDALPRRRPLVRYCVDWSERRHHLSGAVGAALTDRFFTLGWIRSGTRPRVVHLTDEGGVGLSARLGVEIPARDTVS